MRFMQRFDGVIVEVEDSYIKHYKNKGWILINGIFNTKFFPTPVEYGAIRIYDDLSKEDIKVLRDNRKHQQLLKDRRSAIIGDGLWIWEDDYEAIEIYRRILLKFIKPQDIGIRSYSSRSKII